MQLWINNWASALLQPLAAGATTVEVDPSAAARLTGLGSGGYYLLTLIGTDELGNENAWEIVCVTAAAGGALTIERAQEGTAAREWPAGTGLELRITAGVLSEIPRTPEDIGAEAAGAASVLAAMVVDLQTRVDALEQASPPPSTADGLISLAGIGRRNTVYANYVTATIPGEVQAGDLLVASVAQRGIAPLPAPNGWTLQQRTEASSGDQVTASIYTRAAEIGDAGSGVQWVEGGGDNDLAAQIVAFRGASTPSVLDVAHSTVLGTGTNFSPAAPVTATADLQMAYGMCVTTYFDRLLVAPLGWTQLSAVTVQDSQGFANSFMNAACRLLRVGETATGDFVNAGDTAATNNTSASVTLLLGLA